MEKDNQAKVGRTKCDMCDKISACFVGERLLCTEHASLAKTAAVDAPLKDAGLAFRDHHR